MILFWILLPCSCLCFEFKIIFFSLFSGYHFGVYISEIKPFQGAYYLCHDERSNVKLEVGQQIKKVNGKSLDGKSYLDIVEIIRDTRDFYTLNLLVADVGENSEKSSGNKFCCSLFWNQYCLEIKRKAFLFYACYRHLFMILTNKFPIPSL